MHWDMCIQQGVCVHMFAMNCACCCGCAFGHIWMDEQAIVVIRMPWYLWRMLLKAAIITMMSRIVSICKSSMENNKRYSISNGAHSAPVYSAIVSYMLSSMPVERVPLNVFSLSHWNLRRALHQRWYAFQCLHVLYERQEVLSCVWQSKAHRVCKQHQLYQVMA